MRRIWRFFRKLFLFIIVSHLAYIVVLKWVNPPITITQIESLLENRELKRDYVAYKEISPHIKLAVIASEDQLFPTHSGFDLKQIEKALEYNKENKKGKIRGGSTISQQVAKNVFLWQGRSWLRKGLESYFTLMIEWVWGKQRILEMYLNVSEMGIGVYGIEAASQYYFSKSANSLSKNEAARIAVVLPLPKKYNINPPSNYVKRRAVWVERQMNNLQGSEELSSLIE